MELLPTHNAPRVFLHGNPHLDNFAKTEQGEAIIDFDRSRRGPYSWDIARFMTSLSLRRDSFSKELLSKQVIDAFLTSYRKALSTTSAQLPKAPTLLDHRKPREGETSMKDYLSANKKWAKLLRQNPLLPSHPTVQAFLRLYFEGRHQPEAIDHYTIEEAGLAEGSLGKPRILIVLSPKRKDEDMILLDIKEVYQDRDTPHFFNPYVHHGLRMIEASHLYAPGMEQMLSYLTWRGNQYWGRKIPCFKRKIKGNLNEKSQEKLAESVGLQLGRAHRLSLREATPDHILKHLATQCSHLIETCQQLNRELAAQWIESRKSSPLLATSV